jgi:4a-hydroxytetrahydrobiopterin dehydratase
VIGEKTGMKSTHKKLSEIDIEKKLKNLSTWKVNAKHTELSSMFTFPDFIHGLAFVAKIAVHAEILNHHPTIELSYGKVTVHITTYEIKALTNLDFELAKRINKLLTQ